MPNPDLAEVIDEWMGARAFYDGAIDKNVASMRRLIADKGEIEAVRVFRKSLGGGSVGALAFTATWAIFRLTRLPEEGHTP